MRQRNGLARGEDGESRRAGGFRCPAKGVLDLDTGEAGAGAVVGGDSEGIRGKRVQSTTGVIEEPEGLVTSVGKSSDNLQVLDAVNSFGPRDLEREARCCRHSHCRGRESEQSCAKSAGEHSARCKWNTVNRVTKEKST